MGLDLYSDAYKRFCLFTLVSWVVSSLYPTALFLSAKPESDAFRWFIHNSSFSLYHYFVISLAIGVFFSLFRNIHELIPVGRGKLFSCLSYFLFFAILMFAFFIVYIDVQEPGVKPTDIKDHAARVCAYEFEKNKRFSDQDSSFDYLNDKQSNLGNKYILSEKSYYCLEEKFGSKEYLAAIGLGSNSITRLYGGNLTSKASIIIDLYFATFVAIFVWYLCMQLFSAGLKLSIKPKPELLIVYLFLGFWFPFRYYGTWYSSHFLSSEYGHLRASFDILPLLYIVIGVFLILFLSSLLGKKMLAIAVLIFQFFSSYLNIFAFEFYERFALIVQRLPLVHISGLYLLIGVAFIYVSIKAVNDIDTRMRSEQADEPR